MKSKSKKTGRPSDSMAREGATGTGGPPPSGLMGAPSIDACYGRIREILNAARTVLARSVNSIQVIAYWRIGREIVEQEQWGQAHAQYGQRLLMDISYRMTAEFGSGFSTPNLRYIRQFYVAYPALLEDGEICHAARDKSLKGVGKPAVARPGRFNPDLSWTHYRTLLRVNLPQARAFYEVEAGKHNWSARELERQINTHLYDRLAQSRDKEGAMRLALEGQEVQRPQDVFKDPVVLEFVGLPCPPSLTESALEQAIIDNLQKFLLELGVGFAYIGRQQRFTIEGDHFYFDLALYHYILKCFVLVELKIGKLEPRDLGQLQLYVNFYDAERRGGGDNPTVGLILCTDKNDAVVRYTLGKEQDRIFASRYQMHLPTVEQLEAEVRRELRFIQQPGESAQEQSAGTENPTEDAVKEEAAPYGNPMEPIWVQGARIGSSFSDYLKEEGTYEEATVGAVERVAAWARRRRAS